MHEPLPRLYGALAEWFHLLTPPEDYAEEAEFYARTILGHGRQPHHTLLELGSGGGNNASHMKARFRLTLSDISPAMLDISRALNPECEHILGDMRTLRLGRTFDAIFAQDALDYLTSLEDLRRAALTAWVHCRAGGVVLFAPDAVRETFRAGTQHGGSDGPGRAIRYLEWTWDPDPADYSYRTEMAYLLRDEHGAVRCELDRHELGLFARAEWLEALHAVGFQAQSIPFEHSAIDSGAAEVFVGARP